jgi:hypothetical protein
MWVSVFSSVGLSLFLVLLCSCWLSLIGFDLECFFAMSFARCLLAAAMSFSSVYRERSRETSGGEREKMGRKEGT